MVSLSHGFTCHVNARHRLSRVEGYEVDKTRIDCQKEGGEEDDFEVGPISGVRGGGGGRRDAPRFLPLKLGRGAGPRRWAGSACAGVTCIARLCL